MTQQLIPEDFWNQCSHQLVRITAEKADTFDKVRAILLDLNYTAITADININGVRVFDVDNAFYAGSGGDDELLDALNDAGWEIATFRAHYFYSVTHPHTGESMTYIEGDLQRGDTMHPDF